MSQNRARPSARTGAAGAPARTRGLFRRALLLLALGLVCAALTSCSTLNTLLPSDSGSAAQTGTGPNLALLALPAYNNDEATATPAATAGSAYSNVDLWLDATQNMGGINVSQASMYPHFGRKYREGGFQYRYGSNVGWYENVLRDFLIAAGESHVRTLRYGNETLPDDLLTSFGLDTADASVWRDMHTCDTETRAGMFSQFTAENMADSFYSLGSPLWLNRVAAQGADALENPSLVQPMADALTKQTEEIAAGNAEYVLQEGRDGQNCALLEALQHLDTDKLSVITVDPASVRKTEGTDDQGQPVEYYRQVLTGLGVFDRGLCVGLLDFQLDYMGQMSTFSTADFSEPLVWGRVILNEKKQTFENLGVMPRRMLTLVIGTRARVDAYLAALGDALANDEALKDLRGPRNGELTYTADGKTVTQQPFGFEWHSTVIASPTVPCYTQHTDGAALAADNASVQTQENGVSLVSLTSAADGAQPDRTITVRFPLAADSGGATLNMNALSGAALQTLNTLLLTRTLPNTQENQALIKQDGETALAYRDQLYAFAAGQAGGAFILRGITQENGSLVCTVDVKGAALKPGYYRLRLSADVTGDQFDWQPVPWIDGKESVSASVTDTQVYTWETFTAAITQYDRDSKGLPKLFSHAWGSFTDKPYHSLRVPDFPPVYQSVHLSELAAQFRAAASTATSPLVRCVFEVFVPYPQTETVIPQL